MKIFLLLLCFFSNQLNAQICDCGVRTIRSKWPKEAEENNIYGIVEIKYTLTDSCFITEPLITKSLGYGCDEDAMKMFSQILKYSNDCKRKCGDCNCKSEEKYFTVTFASPEMQILSNQIIYGLKCI